MPIMWLPKGDVRLTGEDRLLGKKGRGRISPSMQLRENRTDQKNNIFRSGKKKD